ncbi:hypothetical protein LTR99_007558 [Exophiala xenobiotica]|uniref:Uncharacterized protein n=1 Tax=Vermiconidia calcicola TaxID=1690605 RepID=A0AAV9Q426_9PEZI|nr:hypothetical protein LTR92_002439 [Exophiala xenobiotica]KAK5530660.1 hypothetical protein LTR23_010255 [Chaetothyriales sp. CCFEE 6169]KAK5534667.1 hypothetical protein LTR25_006699 [Vermiconidia calcicola]KAK5268832.1 hypothetical protein LTR96_005616 [Exophiala xenobiotica]KAK5299290.1 hypothetical protein LTR99_007558 [Exophiala xenobiotica]
MPPVSDSDDPDPKAATATTDQNPQGNQEIHRLRQQDAIPIERRGLRHRFMPTAERQQRLNDDSQVYLKVARLYLLHRTINRRPGGRPGMRYVERHMSADGTIFPPRPEFFFRVGRPDPYSNTDTPEEQARKAAAFKAKWKKSSRSTSSPVEIWKTTMENQMQRKITPRFPVARATRVRRARQVSNGPMVRRGTPSRAVSRAFPVKTSPEKSKYAMPVNPFTREPVNSAVPVKASPEKPVNNALPYMGTAQPPPNNTLPYIAYMQTHQLPMPPQEPRDRSSRMVLPGDEPIVEPLQVDEPPRYTARRTLDGHVNRAIPVRASPEGPVNNTLPPEGGLQTRVPPLRRRPGNRQMRVPPLEPEPLSESPQMRVPSEERLHGNQQLPVPPEEPHGNHQPRVPLEERLYEDPQMRVRSEERLYGDPQLRVRSEERLNGYHRMREPLEERQNGNSQTRLPLEERLYQNRRLRELEDEERLHRDQQLRELEDEARLHSNPRMGVPPERTVTGAPQERVNNPRPWANMGTRMPAERGVAETLQDTGNGVERGVEYEWYQRPQMMEAGPRGVSGLPLPADWDFPESSEALRRIDHYMDVHMFVTSPEYWDYVRSQVIRPSGERLDGSLDAFLPPELRVPEPPRHMSRPPQYEQYGGPPRTLYPELRLDETFEQYMDREILERHRNRETLEQSMDRYGLYGQYGSGVQTTMTPEFRLDEIFEQNLDRYRQYRQYGSGVQTTVPPVSRVHEPRPTAPFVSPERPVNPTRQQPVNSFREYDRYGTLQMSASPERPVNSIRQQPANRVEQHDRYGTPQTSASPERPVNSIRQQPANRAEQHDRYGTPQTSASPERPVNPAHQQPFRQYDRYGTPQTSASPERPINPTRQQPVNRVGQYDRYGTPQTSASPERPVNSIRLQPECRPQ